MEEIVEFIKKHVYLALGAIFLAVVCAVLLMSFYADREMHARGRTDFFVKFARVAANYGADNEFDKNLVLGLAENFQGESYAERCEKVEKISRRLVKEYCFAGVADKDGNVHTSTHCDYNIGDRDYFLALKNGLEIIETDSNNYTYDGKERILYMMARIKDANGDFDGTVFLAKRASEALNYIDVDYFNKQIPSFLIRPDGQVVAYRGQQFLTDNFLNFLESYSDNCHSVVSRIRKDIEINTKGMLTCDYDGGSSIAYYPVESVGREKQDYIVFIMPDKLVADDINIAMVRMNKYLALGVVIVMLLVGSVLYIYLQMDAKIENLSYVSPVTGGPNVQSLCKTLEKEKWTDFNLSVMNIDGYYRTLRHRNLAQMQDLMAKLWRTLDHEFAGGDVKIAYVHSHYFALAIRKSQDEIGEILDKITKSTIKFCQVNNVGILYPRFGVLQEESVNQGLQDDLGRIASITVSHDFQRDGKNYMFCDTEEDVLTIHRGRMLSFFEDAVNSHAFRVEYQPKVNREGKLVGSKIVSSWKMEDGRVLPASDFLVTLSRQGLLPRLDMMNFRTVCTQLRKWKEAGVKILPVSVFISEASFYQEDLVRDYKVMTEVAGVSPENIQIEISESSMVNVANIQKILEDFRAAGFRIILGDFVNGVNGLAKIPQNLIDYLSLGRIVEWVDTDNGYVVCKGIVAMAKKIGMKVILGHIDSEQRRAKVDEMDFDELTGACVGAALPADKFTKLLEKNGVAL